MPLLFIALFLGSFLIGAGTSYVTQGQQGIGIGGGTPVVTTNPNVTITPNPQQCLPERDTISAKHQIRPSDGAISVEATVDWHNNIYADDNMTSKLRIKDNWTNILLWLFGGVSRHNHPIPSGFNLDRKSNTWTLIKQGVWIPSWKVAYRSGDMKWNIGDCVWDLDEDNCDEPNPPGENRTQVRFHEMTRIGILTDTFSTSFLQGRYKKSGFDDAKGDIWVATGWCGEGGYGTQTLDAIGSQIACADPLLRNFLFIVTKKGNGERLGRENYPSDWNQEPWKDPDNPDNSPNPEDRKNSWWQFDLYYDFGSRVVTYENLPCWTRGYCTFGTDFNAMLHPAGRDAPGNILNLPCSEITPAVILPPGAYNYQQNLKIISFNPFGKIKVIISLVKEKINKLASLIKISENVSAQTTVQFPQFVSGKSITYTNPSDPRLDKIKLNTYIIAAPITLPSGTEKIGTITGSGGNEFVIYAADLAVPTPTAPPNPTPNEYMGLQIIYVEYSGQARQYMFVHKESTQGETLKLRTFYPPIIEETPPAIPATFTYEWYTPACKPAIYLYPGNPLELSVVVRPQGHITQSIPEHGDRGWKNILAKPNGELVFNNKPLPYLYYEAEVKNVNPPTQGWVVKKEELNSFFDTTLPYLGLNSQEKVDFKNYWLKKLSAKPYYFVGLIERNVLDKLENVEFSIKPDNFIRVRFYFEGLDKPAVITSPLLPKTPERKGFTAVDWGGMLAGGTCNNGVIKIN